MNSPYEVPRIRQFHFLISETANSFNGQKQKRKTARQAIGFLSNEVCPRHGELSSWASRMTATARYVFRSAGPAKQASKRAGGRTGRQAGVHQSSRQQTMMATSMRETETVRIKQSEALVPELQGVGTEL